MIPTRFEEIAPDDILRLVELQLAEHQTLEYKEKLLFSNDEDRKEFLADVTSFANASGGDIIFGVADGRDTQGKSTGIPTRITGLLLDNASVECNRIEQIIRDGVQPRLPLVQVKPIEVSGSGWVIIVRVGKSWISPHMVTFKNLSRFYSRNSSTGKVQLDVQQIGAAFTIQRGLGERLRSWKADRIAKAVLDNGPIGLRGSKLLLHFISIAELTGEVVENSSSFNPIEWRKSRQFNLLGTSVARYNADGYLLRSDVSPEGAGSYLQVFRSGSLEFADSRTFYSQGRMHIAANNFEQNLSETFKSILGLLERMGVQHTMFVTVSLTGMKGRLFATSPPSLSYGSYEFDRDVVSTPEIRLDDLQSNTALETMLLPLVNAIWQAAGVEKTPFQSDGKWNYGD